MEALDSTVTRPDRAQTSAHNVIETDVAIVGGGLAGSLASAMLGRAGIANVLIDPRTAYPPDFRCEKLDGGQVAILEKTGLLQAVLDASTHDGVSWVARFGHLVDKRTGDQHGILYPDLVNTVRSQIPHDVRRIYAKAVSLATDIEGQRVCLSTGQEVVSRLIVLANGLNYMLRDKIGLTRKVLNACHSISIGFDVAPIGQSRFGFPALTYYAERPSDRTAMLTLFPIGHTMRANLFVYRDFDDPWLQLFRDSPRDRLFVLMPGLRKLTGDLEVTGPVKIRPVDLYATENPIRSGMVLVGDAFSTSCPAAGTGARKVLNDVERLCNVHIPEWLATPGMPASKIAAFYDDPVKRACDDFSLDKAMALKAFSVDPAPYWQLCRWIKFLAHGGVGMLRRLRIRLVLPPVPPFSSTTQPTGGALLGRPLASVKTFCTHFQHLARRLLVSEGGRVAWRRDRE